MRVSDQGRSVAPPASSGPPVEPELTVEPELMVEPDLTVETEQAVVFAAPTVEVDRLTVEADAPRRPDVDELKRGRRAFQRAVAERHRHLQLVRGSTALLVSTLVHAAGGFLFWLVAARLTGADDVGRAAALVSSSVFVLYAT